MKIEAGKYYKTRDGRKVGPATVRPEIKEYPVWVDNEGSYTMEGSHFKGKAYPSDLISEWPTSASPVRTVTKREIVPGQYGPVYVLPFRGEHCSTFKPAVHVGIANFYADAAACRAAAATLIELADALEEG